MSGFELQLKAALAGDYEKEIDKGRLLVERSIRRAVSEAGVELRDKLRADLLQSGLVNAAKLTKTWRTRDYPRGRVSTMSPATEIRSTFPIVQRAFEEGVEIRAQDGKWLAIPNPKVFPQRLRRRRGQSQVAIATARFGKLRFVKLANNPKLALLVAEVRASKGKRGGFRAPTATARKRGDYEEQAIFFLVKQSRVPRLLRGEVIRRRAERDAPARIAQLFVRFFEQDNGQALIAGPRS